MNGNETILSKFYGVICKEDQKKIKRLLKRNGLWFNGQERVQGVDLLWAIHRLRRPKGPIKAASLRVLRSLQLDIPVHWYPDRVGGLGGEQSCSDTLAIVRDNSFPCVRSRLFLSKQVRPRPRCVLVSVILLLLFHGKGWLNTDRRATALNLLKNVSVSLQTKKINER